MGGSLSRPVTTQFAELYKNKYYFVGTSCMNGRRTEMEDQHTIELNLDSGTSFFGVYDGHVGKFTSRFLKNNLHKHIPLPFEINDSEISKYLSQIKINMVKLDHHLLNECKEKSNYDNSGSTACFAVLKPKDNHYYDLLVGNIGDSRVIVVGKDGKLKYHTLDHKPSNPIERKRITNAGGYVSNENRINGDLALSRGFGDNIYKQNSELNANEQMVICEPDLFTDRSIAKGDVLILACDGIFEKLSFEQVASFVHTSIYNKNIDPRQTCIDLINYSLELGSGDNMSVVIVKINPIYNDENDKETENVTMVYEPKFILGEKDEDIETNCKNNSYCEAFINFIQMHNLSLEDVKTQILDEWNLDENSQFIKAIFKTTTQKNLNASSIAKL